MRYLIIFILITSALILVSDEFELVDLTNRTTDFEQSLSNKLKSKVVIDGSIVLKLLPTPHLEIINFKVFDLEKLVFSTNKIVFDLEISGLFNDISVLKRIRARMNKASVKAIDFSKYISFSKENSDILITIAKADIEIDKNNILKDEFEISNLIFSTTLGEVMTSGQIGLRNQKLLYSLKIHNEKDILLNVDNEGFSFNVSLNDFDSEKLILKDGKFDFTVKKIDSILQLIVDGYEPKQPKIQLDKAVEYELDLSGDLILDLNNEISLDNIRINSNFIDGLTIDWRLYKVMDNLLESYLYISADKINLNYINDIVAGNLQVNDLFRKILTTSNIAQYINLNFNLDLQKLILNDGEINNFFLSTYHILTKIIIDKLDLNLPGESKMNFYGVISGNEIRRKITGELAVISDDDIALLRWYNKESPDTNTEKNKLSVTSKIFGMQNLFKANNYTLKRGEKSIVGNVYVYDVPYDSPVKIIAVDGQNLDFDLMGFTSEWDIYLKKLYDADADKSGEDYFKLTNANSWIRSINKHFYLNLNLNNTTFRSKQIPKIKAIIEIFPGELDVKKLIIRDDRIDGELKFKFILPVLRPQITGSMLFNTIDLRYAVDLLIPNFDTTSNIPNKSNFLSANNYDGNLKFKVANLIINDNIKPSSIDGEVDLRFGYIFIPNLKYSLWNGKFDVTSSMIISNRDPTFDCAFSIYNIDPQEIFYNITGVDKIKGYMSFAGSLQGRLIKWDNAKKFDGQIDFLGAQIAWDGLNLNKVVEVVDGNYTKSSKLQSLEYYTNYGSTNFDSLRGKMLINNGLVSIDNASMTNNRLAGLFSMNFDIPSKTISSVSSFAFIPTGATQPVTIHYKTSGNVIKPTENTVDYKEVLDFVNGSSSKN